MATPNSAFAPPASSSSSIPFQLIECLQGHIGPVTCARYNPNGLYCMTGGQDKCIKLWNPKKGLLIQTYQGLHNRDVQDVAIMQDNSKFGSVGGDKLAFLWDVATGKCLQKFWGHQGRINRCLLICHDQVFCTASYDRKVKLWDTRSPSRTPIQSLEEAKDSVTGVIANQHNLITCSVDGCIRRYDIRKGQLYSDALHVPLTSVNLSSENECILVSCLDHTIRLLLYDTGELLSEYKGHRHHQHPLNSIIDPTNTYILSGSEDGKLYVWNIFKNQMSQKINMQSHAYQAHQKSILFIEMNPSSPYLLTSSADHTIKVWRPNFE